MELKGSVERKGVRSRRGGGCWEDGWGRLRRPGGRCLVCERCEFGHAGRRKRPHTTQHHSRPYEDSELEMPWQAGSQK